MAALGYVKQSYSGPGRFALPGRGSQPTLSPAGRERTMPPRGWPRGVGVLVVAFGLLVAGYAQAGINQWTSYGPGEVDIFIFSSALAVDPSNSSVLYLGAGGGVYKSTDGGQHWTATDRPSASVTALVVDPINS